jgi:phosphatidate cytidylyltransferase
LKNNFIKRSVTALFFVAFLLSGIFINLWVFPAVFSVFMGFSLWEFYELAEKGGYKPQKIFGLINGIIIFILFFLNAVGIIPVKLLLISVLPVTVMLIAELYRDADDNFKNLAFSVLGLFYVALPFAVMNYIAVNSFTQNTFKPVFLFPFFLMLWANDTGAYLTGVLIGKHKLFEKISPKKTWEGSGGGMVFTFVAAFVTSLFYSELNIFQWLGFAAIIVVFGTYGDLAESLFKRRTGVKDSGNILPGHGGMLDRFDSALLAAPLIFLYITILEII